MRPLHQIPSFGAQRTLLKKRWKDCKSQWDGRDQGNKILYIRHDWCTCEPTETVVTVQRACRGVAPEGVPVLRGRVDPSHCYNHLEAYDPSNDP